MEMFCFGILVGLLTSIIFIGCGVLYDRNNNDSVSSVCDRNGSRGSDKSDSKPPYRSKETVIFYLGEMEYILGLCRTEKETLEDAIYYLKEGE